MILKSNIERKNVHYQCSTMVRKKNEKMQEYRKNWNGKWENAQTEQ